MWEFSKDAERTRLAYASRVLVDDKKRSYFSNAGHVFLRGKDREKQWNHLYEYRKGICETCGRWRPESRVDMDHDGRTPKTRCDCLCQVLNDGTTCTGIHLRCTMNPEKGGGPTSCHARRHNREIGGRR